MGALRIGGGRGWEGRKKCIGVGKCRVELHGVAG